VGKKISDEEKYKIIDGKKHKLCSSCKKYVPLEEFSSRSVSPDGLAYSCKTCERATAKKSYNGKKQKKKAKERYEENKEVYNERAKQRYIENKDEILAKQADWRKTKKGQKVMNEAGARRRERISAQTPGGRDYTRQEIIDKDTVNGVCICQICGKPILNMEAELQIDHIVPIAAEGSDTKDNVRCAHKTCNITRPKDGKDLEA
jgi:5-methylcytosine-specific restriction endonuclease McrA